MALAFTILGALVIVAIAIWTYDYATCGKAGEHWPTEPAPKQQNQATSKGQPNVEQYRPTCPCGKTKKEESR